MSTLYTDIPFYYYVTRSLSGQVESNPVLWFATRAGLKVGFFPQMINFSWTKVVWLKWLFVVQLRFQSTPSVLNLYFAVHHKQKKLAGLT